ncbi:methionine aminopeptidase [Kribbia dieselivorans]|uniref:methionine aminopeptidase n=1 Tax=Kribbia dieselivorans TaxID=331526 RepID=UPI001FE21A90|nr:methionine aminopeptidase [Kribbia dieselivorans]
MPFWFNIRTNQVETDENRARGEDVLGPYDTEEEARNALDTAHKRTEAWDAEDERRAKEDAWPDEIEDIERHRREGTHGGPLGDVLGD